MEEEYCLSRLYSRVVIFSNFIVLDIFVLSSDLTTFKMER